MILTSFVGRLFSRPHYGYYRPRIFPYNGLGGWGMGHPHGPMMHHGPHHHNHHTGYSPIGHGRRW